MSSPSVHPRRRPQKSMGPPSLHTMSLRKGTTFNARHHQDESPVEQARYMPRRSQTCTKTLEDLLPQESGRQNHVAKLLQDFDDKINGRKSAVGDGSILKEEEVLAVPSFMVNQAIVPDPMDIDQKALVTDHQHASDSGLGSSVASSIEQNTRRSTRSAQSISTSHSTVTRSASTIGAGYPRAEQLLSKEAERHIRTHIIKPILEEDTLKDFHPLVEDIPRRIGARFISNLRDLEKTLFFLAPIRRYAEIMARTREKEASGQALDEMDYSPDEEIAIEGGLSKNGKPAELVRKTKDGKVIPLSEHSLIDEASPSSKRPLLEDDMDDDIYRSMARRRKSEKPGDVMHPCRVCDKEFKRPCDLTKHEKTHSRPWKCPDPKCKYHEHGWPTEKERDRHVNDKHNAAPQMYQCRFKPCTYSSKRESNCKQHMEKAHGWTYVRSKSNGRTKADGSSDLSPVAPLTPFMATPSSGMNNLTSPESNFMPSPAMPVNNNFNFGGFSYTPGPSSTEDLFDFGNSGLRRESVATTGSVMTFSSGSNFSPAQQMNSAFEDALSPDNLTFDQPLFGVDGLTDNFTMPVQQPTPAHSVNNGFENFAGLSGNHLSPAGQANMTLYTPQTETAHFDEALGNDMGFGQDFTLFDQAGPSNTNNLPAVTSQWYPDMGTIGGQFGDFGFSNTNGGFDDPFGGLH